MGGHKKKRRTMKVAVTSTLPGKRPPPISWKENEAFLYRSFPIPPLRLQDLVGLSSLCFPPILLLRRPFPFFGKLCCPPYCRKKRWEDDDKSVISSRGPLLAVLPVSTGNSLLKIKRGTGFGNRFTAIGSRQEILCYVNETCYF